MLLPTPTIVVHLNIELPKNPDTIAALSDLLHSVAELPGVAVTQCAVPELPYPRKSTSDSGTTGCGSCRTRGPCCATTCRSH